MRSNRHISNSIIREDTILQEAKQGDREAFALIVKLYFKRVFRVAYRYLHNIHDAEDITQMSFLNAYNNISNFDIKKPFFPWIYQITKNLSINFIQKQKQSTKKSISIDSYESNTPELELLKNEETTEIKRALLRLNSEAREILILKHWDNCSYREISEILSIPIGTVMSRLYYARQKLKEEILKTEEVKDEL